MAAKLDYYYYIIRILLIILRRRRRRRAVAPTSNTAGHDYHENFYRYGAPLGGPLGRRSSAMKPLTLGAGLFTQL